MSRCALCCRQEPLRRSHIIPEFVYRQIYDSKHRFRVLSTLNKDMRSLEQKGIRERLLCADCENQFSGYERYARGVLLGGESLTVSHEGDYLQLEDLVYDTLKLFQMSILWRAAVAKHAMFARVKLGQHQETLRAMLEAGEAGWPEQYPCVVIGLKSQRPNIAANFIDQPTRLRLHGHIAYRFYSPGLYGFTMSRPIDCLAISARSF